MNSSIRSHVLAVLAVLCLALGSVGAARAASVTGGGTFFGSFGNIPLAVSARGGPGAAQGIVFLGPVFNTQLWGNVVDLHVAGNAAVVTSIVTRSTNPNAVEVNATLYLLVLDEGANGAFVGAVVIGGPYDPNFWSVALTAALSLDSNGNGSPIHGQIVVTP